MTPLQRLKSHDARLQDLLDPLPSLEQLLDLCLADLAAGETVRARDLTIDQRSLLDQVGEHLRTGQPFTLPTGARTALHGRALNEAERVTLVASIGAFTRQLRARYHASLAEYWTDPGQQGTSRRKRLLQLRREQFFDEIALRLADQTLTAEQAYTLRIALELPHAWQRQRLPAAQQPQVYRPLLEIGSPHWRTHLPGALVIVASGPAGQTLAHHADVGHALLCSLSHGIEAFASLTDLHTELCERLDDPLQGEPLLKLCTRQSDREQARLAERLRYDWFAADMLEEQLDHLIDAQSARLSHAWIDAWNTGIQRHLDAFDALLAKSLDVRSQLVCKNALATRYALLLERHLPDWLRNAPQQALTHIVQAMQELIIAVDRAGAPGILTLEQFRQRHTLLAWTRERLRERLRHAYGLDLNPSSIKVSITLARQIGPLLNPLTNSSYVAGASRPQVGGTLQLIKTTYDLDELALLNIAWLDVDYWLTARVHLEDGSLIEGLTSGIVRQMIRDLDAGNGYTRYLQAQLIDSPAGQWRQEAHGRINHARMQAEAVKANYAGHFLPDPLQQGYRWVKTILRYPDSNWRATVDEHRITVRQLVIQSHTVQGVLLLHAEVRSIASFVIYAPDAPDRRPWREYRSIRQLMRALRRSPQMRRYVTQRMPLADPVRIDKLLRKGGLAPHVQRPTIDGDLFKACYLAEVHALMAVVDQGTRSNRELLGELALNALWILLDLVSLVLPSRPLSALAFGRAAISVINGLEAFEEGDRSEALDHAFNAVSHTLDGINSFAGSTVMRQTLRGLPKPPSAPIPVHYSATPGTRHLRALGGSQLGEGIFEQRSPEHGLRQYFIQDKQGLHYQVTFDGIRWRAVDPRQPDAYLKVPVKRLENGEWVTDSPVLWYDGLPDLTQLLSDCALAEPLDGQPVPEAQALYSANGQLYVQVGALQLPVRQHLLQAHYHLQLPATEGGQRIAWAVLRWHLGQWQIRLRQAGRASEWLALPPLYSVIRGRS
ncbi:hypothetical protein PS910_03582 [Pseudomonas fluorescens]|nr:hypothetical protein PS910_03582 [Pseudomonas fluorescens]